MNLKRIFYLSIINSDVDRPSHTFKKNPMPLGQLNLDFHKGQGAGEFCPNQRIAKYKRMMYYGYPKPYLDIFGYLSISCPFTNYILDIIYYL